MAWLLLGLAGLLEIAFALGMKSSEGFTRLLPALFTAATGLSSSHMPTLYEGNQLTGKLRAELAEAWGMARVPVVAGGGDNAAGAVGVGVVRAGDGFLSLGTSGVLFLANDGYRPNPAGGVHTFCHALPAHWHQMSVILSDHR